MKLRIVLVLVVIALLGGTAGYWLTHSHQRQIRRWREASQFFFQQLGDVARAEELNDKILEVLPESSYDLVWRASLLVRKGGRENLEKALEIYDRLSARGDETAAGLQLLKAQIHRRLGQLSESRAAARSVFDLLPFQCSMELGVTALRDLSPYEALQSFEKAEKHYARSDLERARASAAKADVYALLLALHSGPGAESEEPRESWEDPKRFEERMRSELDTAYGLLEGIPEEYVSKDAVRRQIALVAMRRSSVRQAGETPCLDAARLIEKRMKEQEESPEELSPTTCLSVGRLLLLAAWQELEGSQEDSERLRASCVERAVDLLSLLFVRNSPEDARKLLLSDPASDVPLSESPEPPPELRAWRTYVKNLIGLSRFFVESPDYRRILDDSSKLALSRRLDDALPCPNSDVAGIARLSKGLALLRDGDSVRARQFLQGYVERLDQEERPRALLQIAEYCGRFVPEKAAVFEYLDRYRSLEESPFASLGRRVRLLVAARNVESLAEESKTRLEATLERAEQAARTGDDHVLLARVYLLLEGRNKPIAVLSRGIQQLPDDRTLREALARMLESRANERKRPGPDAISPEALADYRAAFQNYLALFVARPAREFSLLERLVVLANVLSRSEPDGSLVPLVRPLFPGAPDRELDAFSATLRAFLQGRHDEAVAQANRLSAPEPFQPFLSFLVGTCHLLLADGTLAKTKPDEAARVERLGRAQSAFQKHAEFLPNRLELLALELRSIDAGDDVSEALIQRIEALAAEDVHQAHWLLAKALDGRLKHRLSDSSRNAKELLQIHDGTRKSLRAVIQHNPRHVAAYLALADQVARGLERNTPGGQVEVLLAPNYERAAQVLHAVPNPNGQVLTGLANLLERLKEPAKARSYLLAVTLLKPDSAKLWKLYSNYSSTNDSEIFQSLLLDRWVQPEEPTLDEEQTRYRSAVTKLLSSGAAMEPSVRVQATWSLVRTADVRKPHLRPALLAVLRERLKQILEFPALRCYVLGQLHSDELDRQNRTGTARRETGERVLEYFELAVKAYRDLGVPTPLVLQNNLAWRLAEDPDPTRRQRSLELAKEALQRASGHPEAGNLRGTFAWALHRNGRTSEAAKEFRELLETKDSPSSRYWYAKVLFSSAKYREALTEAQRALEAPGSFAEREAARLLMAKVQEIYRKQLLEERRAREKEIEARLKEAAAPDVGPKKKASGGDPEG